MDGARSESWLILRCAGPSTSRLATSLAHAGLDAWTPRQMIATRRPRSAKKVEHEVAIMPTFVFVRAPHLSDLLRIRSAPASPHPAFSLFRYHGRVPLIADGEMSSLRRAEAQAAEAAERRRGGEKRKERHTFPLGSKVRTSEGGFGGMTGIAQGGDGRYVLVGFGGPLEVKIAAFLVESDEVENSRPVEGAAAQAA